MSPTSSPFSLKASPPDQQLAKQITSNDLSTPHNMNIHTRHRSEAHRTPDQKIPSEKEIQMHQDGSLTDRKGIGIAENNCDSDNAGAFDIL